MRAGTGGGARERPIFYFLQKSKSFPNSPRNITPRSTPDLTSSPPTTLRAATDHPPPRPSASLLPDHRPPAPNHLIAASSSSTTWPSNPLSLRTDLRPVDPRRRRAPLPCRPPSLGRPQKAPPPQAVWFSCDLDLLPRSTSSLPQAAASISGSSSPRQHLLHEAPLRARIRSLHGWMYGLKNSQVCEVYRPLQDPLVSWCSEIVSMNEQNTSLREKISFTAKGLTSKVFPKPRRAWLPTGCLKLLDILRQALASMSLTASDFSYLPDVSIPGSRAPLVSSKGDADIFFPTDFWMLAQIDQHLDLFGKCLDPYPQ